MRIGDGLRKALAAQGYTARWARDGHGALDLVVQDDYDLVLLDLGLPDLDGIEVCRRLRAASRDCVLVCLTARTEEVDVVVGLDAGADDYLTKPFRLAELLARIRAHLRRSSPPACVGRIAAGDVEVDLSARRVWLDGSELELRAKEFDLLALLIAEAGRVLTRERIMSDVWDEHWFGSTKTLDMHISALRRKLGEDGRHPSRITTLRGVGYRFEQP